MTSQDVSCAAQKSLQEIRARKTGGIQNTPLVPAQNIGGVIVPGAVGIQKYQGSAQIIQKSSLVPSTLQRVSFSQAQALDSGNNVDGGVITNMSEPQINTPETEKMNLSQSGLLYTLHMIREPVVDYQETRGVPRNEEITFVTLVTSLCTQAYTAAITILVMLWNLMPLVDGLVYFVRFFLDKLIDIIQTPDNKDKAIKGAIFFGELTVITFIIFMIVGLIFMPVYVLMARLFSKVFSMVAW